MHYRLFSISLFWKIRFSYIFQRSTPKSLCDSFWQYFGKIGLWSLFSAPFFWSKTTRSIQYIANYSSCSARLKLNNQIDFIVLNVLKGLAVYISVQVPQSTFQICGMSYYVIITSDTELDGQNSLVLEHIWF